MTGVHLKAELGAVRRLDGAEVEGLIPLGMAVALDRLCLLRFLGQLLLIGIQAKCRIRGCAFPHPQPPSGMATAQLPQLLPAVHLVA